MRIGNLACLLGVGVAVCAGTVVAQEPAPETTTAGEPATPAPAAPPPPPPATPPLPPDAPPPAAEQSTPTPTVEPGPLDGARAQPGSETCVPRCRTGYACVQGRCISACNPPCSIGEICTDAGECVLRAPEPLPGDAAAARLDRGFERHDGFFLRLTTGLGGGAVTLDVPDEPEQTYSGGGLSLSVDVGGSPVEDLVIFGRVRGAWLIEPALRVDGEERDDNLEGLSVNQGMVGAGLNYYIMPQNLYFGGVVGFAVVEAVRRVPNRDDESDSSEIGFGIDLDLGKEWWVDANWGIGVALRLSLSAVPANEELGRDAMFGSGFVAILFSATYQ